MEVVIYCIYLRLRSGEYIFSSPGSERSRCFLQSKRNCFPGYVRFARFFDDVGVYTHSSIVTLQGTSMVCFLKRISGACFCVLVELCMIVCTRLSPESGLLCFHLGSQANCCFVCVKTQLSVCLHHEHQGPDVV